jgi:hypothetical protein
VHSRARASTADRHVFEFQVLLLPSTVIIRLAIVPASIITVVVAPTPVGPIVAVAVVVSAIIAGRVRVVAARIPVIANIRIIVVRFRITSLATISVVPLPGIARRGPNKEREWQRDSKADLGLSRLSDTQTQHCQKSQKSFFHAEKPPTGSLPQLHSTSIKGGSRIVRTL